MSQPKSNLPQEAPTLSIRGVDLWESWLSPVRQRRILEDIRAIVTKAPLFEPFTIRRGQLSSCFEGLLWPTVTVWLCRKFFAPWAI